MTTLTRRCARAAAVTAVASTLVFGAAGAAQADPPADWTGGVQAEFGRVTWVHEGSYPGAKGNWHVGELMIEEDDDGVTGSIIDWRCPDGVEPPGPLVWPPPPTTCQEEGRTVIWDLDPVDVATYDHATDRLTMSGQFDEVDSNYGVIGTVAIDLTMRGQGIPWVSEFPSADGTSLYYDEFFDDAKVRGRVDGHRVSGPKVTQVDTFVGFAIYDMTPAR
jgi:hypothetical protein